MESSLIENPDTSLGRHNSFLIIQRLEKEAIDAICKVEKPMLKYYETREVDFMQA